MRAKVTIMILILAALASVLIVPAQALASGDGDACGGYIGGYDVAGVATVPRVTNGVVIPVVDAKTGPVYVDVRDLLSDGDTRVSDDDASFSIWIYQESNKLKGLQAGGHSIIPDAAVSSGQDPCTKYNTYKKCVKWQDKSKKKCTKYVTVNPRGHDQDIF